MPPPRMSLIIAITKTNIDMTNPAIATPDLFFFAIGIIPKINPNKPKIKAIQLRTPSSGMSPTTPITRPMIESIKLATPIKPPKFNLLKFKNPIR